MVMKRLFTHYDNDFQVKSDLERLERELDFVEAQQTELEEMLVPLERQAEAMGTESIQSHADVERETTYHAAGRVNLQLQTMADTTRDIIERINASNKSSSDESPVCNHLFKYHYNGNTHHYYHDSIIIHIPLFYIPFQMELTSRILNMHMDALQNIQNNINTLKEKIEDVNKLMGVARI